LKRFFDFIFSLCGLILLSPLMLLVSIILAKVNKGAGVFFYQMRPGKNEHLFKVVKFKSMTEECDSNGTLLSNSERLTKFGKFTRSTSIDELPQLFNILKGDMSFIGPRPLLIRYLPFYTEIEKKRHCVRPGITGLAQINGRNLIDWDTRLALDVLYVENISFWGDVKIVLKTIRNVSTAKDIVIDTKQELQDLDIERKICSIK
jgi:undecaprenyl phosphate N,N'-diacetylbacillosamine 1-phosphate transferase